MKNILSAAERLAVCKELPIEKLPSTLKTPIHLNNISQIRLHYQPMCKNIGASLQFLRKYGPAIRYYNPELTLTRQQDEEGPLGMSFEVYKKGESTPTLIKLEKIKNNEALMMRVQEINDGG